MSPGQPQHHGGPLGLTKSRRRTASLPFDPADAGLSARPSDPALRCSTDMKLDASWYADKEWRGFVLHDARHDLEDRHVFVTWVAGISHYPAAVDLPDFAPGSDLVLRPEPETRSIRTRSACGTPAARSRSGSCLPSSSVIYRACRRSFTD